MKKQNSHPLVSIDSPSSSIAIQEKVFGQEEFLVIAGPCAVESESQILLAANIVKESGAIALRGGAFKPRSSPYSFQGYGEEALKWMAKARELTGLPVVTEVMDHTLLSMMDPYVDVFQVGSRNMQNFPLLKALGKTQKTVLLKRGMGNTIEEFLLSAEYILEQGNQKVILCERGIRGFEPSARFIFDLTSIPILKSKTHLPVIADPSHSAGNWKYVLSIAIGALAAGADGLLVEVHPEPKEALCDGKQSLSPSSFAKLMRQVKVLQDAFRGKSCSV